MNLQNRIASALLAGSLLFGMLPAAGAANESTEHGSATLKYEITKNEGGNEAELTLTVDSVLDKDVSSAQLSITLKGVYEDVIGENGEIVQKGLLLEHPENQVFTYEVYTGTETTSLTLYLDSIAQLNAGAELPLGTLVTPGDPIEILGGGDEDYDLILLNSYAVEIGRYKLSLEKEEPATPSRPHRRPSSSSSSSSSGSSDTSEKNKVNTPSSTTGGLVTVSPSRAEEGDEVTITATPNPGYVLESIAVYDEDGKKLSLTEEGNDEYTFTMPDGEVDIDAKFAQEGGGSSSQPSAMAFADVPSGEWYHSAVDFVYRNGMMSGTSTSAFSPNLATSRAMIVSILHRLEGSPATGASQFPDVPAGQYYTDAVSWAASSGVVSGYSNGYFQPNDGITREQLAAILYRYAQHKGYDTSATADLSRFSDAASVSSYAAEPMRWAVGCGLISGSSGNRLDPTGGATRAQAAAILMRFCQSFAGMS